MAETGSGVVQMISDAYLSEDDEFAAEEMALMRSMVEHSGRPLSMTVQQVVQVPDRWREMVAWVADGVAAGLDMRTQVAPRPVGVLQGLTSSVNPIAVCPSYREIADLPLAERVAALRDPSAGPASSPSTPPRRAPGGPREHDLHRLRQALPDGGAGELRAAGGVERGRPRRRPRRRRRSRRPSTCSSRTTATSC